MSSPAMAVRIRRMGAADLERVLEIAESVAEAPHWLASAYVAAMDAENLPQRVALVAECDSGDEQDSSGVFEKQTSGAKAHARLAESDAGTKVPAYQSPADQSQTSQSSASRSRSYWVAGFAVASLVAQQAELETIAVAANGQRRGVGGLLLRVLADELRAADVRELNLEVRASNQAALQFYRAHGFEESGHRRRYYADPEEDAVLMRVSLA
jgi:ribosomal-protein-alanine N-acetyltransferase